MLVERVGRVAVYAHDGMPYMRVRVAPEPGYPDCARVFLSERTWATLQADRAAKRKFYESVLSFPNGLHPLFGPDYRRAVRRLTGELRSQAWYAGLAD